MALDTFKNFAKVTVSTGYDAAATSIALTAGHGAKLPAPPFNATWWNDTDYPDPSDDPNVEIVRVTAKATDALTVTRAQESTSASTKNTASKTYRMIAGLTAKSFNVDLASVFAQVCNGRLTLAAGVPEFDARAADVTGATTIYYTPFKGNVISLYDGTVWTTQTFSEISLALGTLTASTNYDVFIYNNAGTLTLELSAAWATNATRTDAIALQDGILVKSGAATRRFLGTIRTTSTTTTEDSMVRRFLWNAENQIIKRAYRDLTAANHNYTGGWRIFNGSADSHIEIVSGKPITANLGFSMGIIASASSNWAGIGINDVSGPTGNFAFCTSVSGVIVGPFSMPWSLGLGYSDINLVENGTGGTYQNASISGTLFC